MSDELNKGLLKNRKGSPPEEAVDKMLAKLAKLTEGARGMVEPEMGVGND